MSHYGVALDEGLTKARAAELLEEFGPNELQDRGSISPWRILLSQFQDLMVMILLIATVVALGSWYADGADGLPADAIVILAIVIANAWLGFTQEYKAERIIAELQASTKASARVVREGTVSEIEQGHLVPGDVVRLEEGDLVPADIVLLRVYGLRANESLLTGESLPVDKKAEPTPEDAPVSERTNEVFAGTVITGGKATGVVVSTGQSTELGKIADTLQSTVSETTPLERRLGQLGTNIGWGVLILSVVIGGAVLLVEGRADTPTLLRVAMFSVALAVAAVPEGLPAVLTVGLSAGARRLAQRNVVCRQMSAVETLGSVTTIVTDKTGTLTKNEMTIRRLFTGVETVEVSGDGYEKEGTVSSTGESVLELIRYGVLAGGADLEPAGDGSYKAIGDPMDAAFLVVAEKAGLDWQKLRQDWKQHDEIPFSSERARVCLVRRNGNEDEVFVKGAPDSVLGLCSKTTSGSPLDEEALSRIAEIEEEFATEALRGLAVAGKTLKEGVDDWESELTFYGLVGFEDPPRSEVPDAITRCRTAGIRVVMCTGDHPVTASAIAKRIGLSQEGEEDAITGPEAKEMSDEMWAEKVKTCHVCARFAPDQKLRLVDALISGGEVAAMTGDGVNDAPALKKVHVGVAMGKGGTAVAVEASDLVLMDDQFSSIVDAVREGRAVYQNIQRFIAFLFSGNFGVVLAMFAGTLLAGFFDLRYEGSILLPLSAAQILWMNLVTDGAPALAFALGRSSESVMSEPPRDPVSPILNNRIWALVALTGSVLAAVFLVLLDLHYAGGIWTWKDWSPVYSRSLAFYALVTARLMNAFNFQDLHRSLLDSSVPTNPFLRGAVALSWLLTLGLVCMSGPASFFGLEVLEISHIFWVTLALPPLVFLPAEIFKRKVI